MDVSTHVWTSTGSCVRCWRGLPGGALKGVLYRESIHSEAVKWYSIAEWRHVERIREGYPRWSETSHARANNGVSNYELYLIGPSPHLCEPK